MNVNEWRHSVPERAAKSQAMTIIPTGYKAKLPNTLSYPLGAQAISEALEGVSQIGVLVVDFWFSNRSRKDWELLIPPQPCRVLSVSYWHAAVNPYRYRNVDIEAGCFEPSWRIRVEPVPRPLRHTVQTKLLTEALPAMKRWLIASQDAGRRTGGHNLVFLFDEHANELRTEENSTIEWTTARVDGNRHD